MPDLSDGANWSETDANNNNPSPNGWPEGMMPSGVNDAARADRGAMKRFWNKINAVQTVSSSAGVYTFTTANTAYPTAYVSGEIYRFRPGGSSVGGEQFQVNALGAKPIWRRIASGSAGLVPIVAQDIIGARSAEVVYDSTINAGLGAFVLTNPFIPLAGDGTGGVTMSGFLAANGYASHAGVGGAFQPNNFNIQWTGTGAHLWIDTVDQGRIVTSTAGNVSIGGGLTATGDIAGANVTASGNITANGTGASSGGVSIYATAGAIRSDVSGTALYLPNGDISAQNAVLAGSTAGGAGSNIALLCSNGAVQVSRAGTAFYAPNGNVVCQGVTAASNIVVTGHVYPSTSNLYYCGIAANYWYQVTAGSGGHQTISDPSLKRDIESAPLGCLDLVRAIEPKTYRWKGEADRTNWGFLAPEVAAVMHGARHRFDGVTTQDGVSFLAYNDMIAVLWAAVRELAAKLEAK